MTDPLGDDRERALVRLLQVGLLAVAGYGLVAGEYSVAVNGLVSLAVTFVPAVLRRDAGISLDPGHVLWLSVAVFVHAVGIVWPYQNLPWYDSVAHALSASVVAGAGYATVKAVERDSDRTHLTPGVETLVVLVFVMAFGVLWEILEFASAATAQLVGGRAVLIQFGLADVIYDLVFNFLGGLVVAAWDPARPDRAADEAAEAMND